MNYFKPHARRVLKRYAGTTMARAVNGVFRLSVVSRWATLAMAVVVNLFSRED